MLISATGDCRGTVPAAVKLGIHPATVTAVPGTRNGNVEEQDALTEEGVELWGC